MTQIEVHAKPRYFRREENRIRHLDERLANWDDLKRQFRHFSFWVMPTERSAKVDELPPVPAARAFVKLLQEVDADPSTHCPRRSRQSHWADASHLPRH